MATLPLENIPEDVRAIVLETQTALKIKKKVGQFSQVNTIYHIIREYKKLSKKES